MEDFSDFVRKQFRISVLFLFMGLTLGLLYSLELIGFSFGPLGVLHIPNARSAHISLMLYGFIPLLLSLLPFGLCAKDGVCPRSGIRSLNSFFFLWYTFLVFMTATLLFGTKRNLTFYDYSYELNFLLAFAGVFYILALFRFAAAYAKPPPWLRITKWVTIAGPFALLILMHPTIGRVEATTEGPHGDHTLGMSLALIPAYYLVIKLYAKRDFAQRGKIFWVLPLAGYLLSIGLRIFSESCSYTQEWAFQSLTLCYVPLLLLWMKEAGISFRSAPFLFISAITFLLIDIEGNILVIPAVRALFHRNDLVIGHAHLAVGIAVFSLAMAIVAPHLRRLRPHRLAIVWSTCLATMALVLSLAGFGEAGLFEISVRAMWITRSAAGLLAILSAIALLLPALEIRLDLSNRFHLYHLAGVLSDGFGGLGLLLIGPALYGAFGIPFEGQYQYVVFGFVSGVGLLHLFGLMQGNHAKAFAYATAWIRLLTAATFYALFKAELLGTEALVIALYDFSFALIYLVGWLEKRGCEYDTAPASSGLHLRSDRLRG